ncbi:hypothetical protein [Zhongshania aliphaticivorans]|uniref:hypothetical protein n=1 Tax=Zhongshania aliphaticivorans TaxID=1470434 RepID=UPI0039C9E9CE
MKVFTVFFAVVILSGCVGNTLPAQNPVSAQESQWRTESYRTPGNDTGVLIISRDTGYRGAACIPLITLDKEHVAPLNVGEKLELHVTGGRHLLRAFPNRNCAASPIETVVDIKKNQVMNYRLGFRGAAMVFIPVGY